MRGIPNHNRPLFVSECARLRALGYTVINPVEINGGTNRTYAECLREDVRLLIDCDAIAMLPGWKVSIGATLEHHVAVALCLTILDAMEISVQCPT